MRWPRPAAAVVALTAAGLVAAFVVAMGYPSEMAARVAEVGSSRPALPVHRVGGVAQLQTGFNGQQGTPRLLLLLSPT